MTLTHARGTELPAIAIAQLRATVRGRVITPDDSAYAAARAVKAGGIDRRPGAIVRVADARDVARVIAFAREQGVPLAVRGGGHSMAGHGVNDGGVVLDLSALNALEIDVPGRAAWAGAGLTAAELTDQAGALGFAVPLGDTGSVGVGGITLAGGMGYLVRQHGLTIDSLLAAEIITADGTLHRVDAEREPDLFWAIRGGGGNVGVVTRFRFRLHPVEQVTGGMLILPATPETIAGFALAAEAAPETVSGIANVMPAPPMPFIPASHHGTPIILATLVHAGGGQAGERALAPFRALAAPIVDHIGPKRYPEVFPPDQEGPGPAASFRTMFVDAIDEDDAAVILGALPEAPGPMGVAQFRILGGAMARVPAEATAFAHRDAPILLNVAAIHGPAGADPARAWVERLVGSLGSVRPGAYSGFLGDEGEARVRAAYPGATWDRLAAIKARFDPENLFRGNHNVPPIAAAEESSAA